MAQFRIVPPAAIMAAMLVGCGSRSQSPGQTETGLPAWIPIYAGGRVSKVETRKAGIETYTDFALEAPADCGKVADWSAEKLKLSGFDVDKVVTRTGGCDGTVRAEGPGRQHSIRMMGGNSNNAGSSSWYNVQAVERDLPDQQSNARLPEWVPQYPGSTASNLVAGEEGGGQSFDFHFATADDAPRVIAWYKQKLQAAQFTIVSSGIGENGSGALTAQDAQGRSILKINVEPAGGKSVVNVSARDGVK